MWSFFLLVTVSTLGFTCSSKPRNYPQEITLWWKDSYSIRRFVSLPLPEKVWRKPVVSLRTWASLFTVAYFLFRDRQARGGRIYWPQAQEVCWRCRIVEKKRNTSVDRLNLSSETAEKFPSLKVSAWTRKTLTWIGQLRGNFLQTDWINLYWSDFVSKRPVSVLKGTDVIVKALFYCSFVL